VFEHRAEFMVMLREGRAIRDRMFDTIEQSHAHDFGNGRLGKGLYEDLLSAVRDSGAPQAAEEFERRFFPYLNPVRTGAEPDTTKDRRRVVWGLAAVLCVAAVSGVLILGLNGFKSTASERLTATEAPIPVAKANEPASAAMTESAPETVAETPISAENAEGSASETMGESAPPMEPEAPPADAPEPAFETTVGAPAMDVEQ
jgi:hypothetical protein